MSLAVADGGLVDVSSAELQGVRNPLGSNFGLLRPFGGFGQDFQANYLRRQESWAIPFPSCL